MRVKDPDFFLNDSFIEMSFPYHTIHRFRHTVQWILVYSWSQAALPQSASKHSHHPKETRTHELLLSVHLPQGPRQPSVCIVAVDLPILDVSQKWNHIICGLLRLTFFAENNVLWSVHAVARVSALFLSTVESYSTERIGHVLSVHSPVGARLDHFHSVCDELCCCGRMPGCLCGRVCVSFVIYLGLDCSVLWWFPV